MKRTFMIVIAVVIGVSMTFGTALAEEPSKMVKFLANTTLADIGHDKVIVKAVKAQNKKGMSVKDIKAMDKKWKAEEGTADYMQAMMDNECGQHLRDLFRSHSYIAEIFVMDNQGANVCLTHKTGDYWQGDEAKFVKAYNGGRGGVFVDEVEVDEMTKVKISQVSVPVVDKGRAIGAITFGIYVANVK